jgi:hypothetical protein
MADVDLLVRTSDVAEARLAILETGWGEHQIAALNELLADHHHLVPFFDKGSRGLRLELPTSVMPTRHPFRIEENEIWRRAVPTRDAFSNVLAPHPMHLLYHACLHFSWSHTMQFGAWRTFRDINELARTGRVDWNEFVQFAAASRAATACYWALRLARLLSNAELPAFAMQRLQSPGGEFVRRAVDRHFLSYIAPGEGPTSPSVRLEKLMWRAAIRPRWSGHTGQHGQPVEEQSWEMVLHGAKPDKPSSRIVRHMKHASEWWNYLTQTFGA